MHKLFLLLWGMAIFIVAQTAPPSITRTAMGEILARQNDPLAQQTMSIDFVDTEISEVLRSISTAYGISIIPDRDISGKISIHLQNVQVMEGLEAMVAAHGLEILREGNIFRVRKASERTRNIVRMNFERMDLDVENQEVKAFIKDFAAKTGLNILARSDLSGTITGSWRNQVPLDGFKAIMEAHGYRIQFRNGFYIVRGDGSPASPPGAPAAPALRPRAGGTGAMDIDVRDGKVSINLQGADLQEVLRNLAEQAKLNIVFYGEARETINASIQNASIEDIVGTILRGSRFTYVLTAEGTLLVAEKGARSALSTSIIFPLDHIKSETALQMIPKSMTAGGLQITDVKEQNSILLTGAFSEIEDVRQFLRLIDVPTIQVVLECIIVEFDRGHTHAYGLNSGNQRRTQAGQPGVSGFWEFPGTSREITMAGGNARIGILGDRFQMELSAMEQTRKANVLARPSISTLNGNKASINVTNTMYFPIQQVSKDGVPINDYRPFNDGISLEITPSVTQAGEITIDIAPEIKTSARSSGDGPRDISTRSLRTTVKLRDGYTVRLGGLIRSNKSRVREHIPFLGSIPYLGWLFSYHSEEEITTELVLYITPRIHKSTDGNVDLVKEYQSIHQGRGYSGMVEKIIENHQTIPLPADTAAPVPANSPNPVPTNSAAPVQDNTATPVPADTTTPAPANNTEIKP